MTKFKYEKAVKAFLSNKVIEEACNKEPSMQGYLHALGESLKGFSPKSASDQRGLEMALEALRGVKRHHRRMHEANQKLQEENKSLTERLSVLEESGAK